MNWTPGRSDISYLRCSLEEAGMFLPVKDSAIGYYVITLCSEFG